MSQETPAMPTISVVVRSYSLDRWDYLVEAVESLLAQTVMPYEVVIIVDHNPELFEQIRRQWPQPLVKVVENPRQRGSSGAWNAGIDAATGDIVAFIDDDAAAEPRWLEQLAAEYAASRVVGVGGSIIPNWLEQRPAWFPDEFDWVVGCTYRGLPEETAPVRNLIGCNMSFRREALVAVGGLREYEGLGHMGKRPIGGDETEMSIRIQAVYPESVMLHCPPAAVHHKVPPMRATLRYFVSRCYLEGQSKAVISDLVGRGDGLSTELQYVLKTLPLGVVRNIVRGIRERNIWHVARGGAIVLGLGTTGVGYLLGSVRIRLRRKDQQAATKAQQPAHS